LPLTGKQDIAAIPRRALIMDSIRAFVKKHAILCFYILTFAFAWGGVLLVIGGPTAIPGAPAKTDALLGAVMVAWFAGPSVSSIVVTALTDGKAGLRALGSRLAKWRVGIGWYAVALLAGPLVYAAGLLALALFYPGHLPAILTAGDRLAVVLFGIISGLIGGGFLEELGWTGFAVHNLISRRGAFRTALIVGILWGAVHFSFVFWVSGANIGDLPPATFFIVRAIDLLVGQLLAFRVLMVWVYERTGSLLIAMLMHAMLSASMLILGPEIITGWPFLAYCVLSSAAAWIIVGAIAGFNRLLRPRAGVVAARTSVGA
jgi:CAAX protease family protein